MIPLLREITLTLFVSLKKGMFAFVKLLGHQIGKHFYLKNIKIRFYSRCSCSTARGRMPPLVPEAAAIDLTLFIFVSHLT